MHVVTVYSAFVSCFMNKLHYFMRTIPNISSLLLPIENTIRNRFIPAITSGCICSEEERILLSLLTRYRGWAIPIFDKQAEGEYKNLLTITTELTRLITVQQMVYMVDELAIKKIKYETKITKRIRTKMSWRIFKITCLKNQNVFYN